MSQILAQQAALAEISQRALAERSPHALFDYVCAVVARTLDTELVDVLDLAPDGRSLRIVAGVGWRPGVVGNVEVPADGGSMSGLTLRTGGPVISEDLRAEKRFEVAEVLVEHGALSGMSVRVGDAAHPYGALAAFTARRGRFSRDDARFLEAVAGLLASAIVRQRAEESLRRGRDEMAAILTTVTEGITVQGPDGRLLYANDAGAQLSGYESAGQLLAASVEELAARFEMFDEEGQPMRLDDLPGRMALRTGRRSPPTLIRFRMGGSGEDRWSVVQASPVHAPDGSVRQVVNVFREVTAQVRAEQAQAVVAEALAALSGTLDPDEAAHRLAELCVPRLADYATVDLLDAEGSLGAAAIAYRDPARLGLARRIRQLRPLSLDDPTGPARVLRTGKAEVVDISPEMLVASAQSDEEREVLLELGLRCYICVPLSAHGRILGALTLGSAESGRLFSEADLRLAEELGARAGTAIDNARLFEAANERRAELDAVLAAMAEAVLVFDLRGRLRLHNRAATELFGGAVPETLEQLRQALGPPEGEELTDGSDEIGGEYQLPDSERWVDARQYSAATEGPARTAAPVVVVVRDVSEARLAQVVRESFLGIMSHELRTPITTIYGGSKLLEHDLAPERQAEIIRDIRAEAERLARLVEDLLVMTRVERGGLEVADEPLLLQRVFPSIIESITATWPSLEVELEVADRLPSVRGELTYLEQVLRNLITNAVRYGEGLAKGITVRVEPADAEVLVRVLDRGPGFSDTSPERLFDLFYRAPPARAVSGGAGIGLFVSRALVEAMGGRMWARQRAEGGAEFCFTLAVIEAD